MRRWMVLVFALGTAAQVSARHRDEGREPIVFHKEWFSPSPDTGFTANNRPYELGGVQGYAAERPAWPGKSGVVTWPPPQAVGRAGDQPVPPRYPMYETDVQAYKASEAALR